MNQKSLKPLIRFKGFTETWKERKLGDSVILNRFPQISAEDLAALNTGHGDVTLLPSSRNYDWKCDSKNIDQLLINDAEIITVGRARNANTKYSEGPFIASQSHIIESFDKSKLNVKFLYYFISLHEKGFYSAESTYPMFTKMDFDDLRLKHPKDVREQENITQLLDFIDSLITLYQRKYESLSNIKKALLEKMFPNDSQAKPEIRFKGFTKSWEQCKFSDIADLKRGLTYNPINLRNIGVRVLRSSNINGEYFRLNDDDVFVSEECINIPFLKNGDILITAANGSSRLIGKHAIVSGIRDNSTVHGGFMFAVTTRNSAFLNASMSSLWYRRFIELYVAGGNGAIGNISKSDLGDAVLLIPNDKEQKRIGKMFEQLDSLINLYHCKYEKLKIIKQSLLEKMLI